MIWSARSILVSTVIALAASLSVLENIGTVLVKQDNHLFGYESLNQIKVVTELRKPNLELPKRVHTLKESVMLRRSETVDACITDWENALAYPKEIMRQAEDTIKSILVDIHVNGMMINAKAGTKINKRSADLLQGLALGNSISNTLTIGNMKAATGRALKNQAFFNHEVAITLKTLRSNSNTAIWALECKVETERFSRVLYSNTDRYIRKIHELLEHSRNGWRHGKLSPKQIPPKELAEFVRGEPAFDNTVFASNPQYLYQVADITLAGAHFNQSTTIIVFDLEFPVVKQSLLTFKISQTGLCRENKDGPSCALFAYPDTVTEIDNKFYNVQHLCHNWQEKDQMCSLKVRRSDATSCIQLHTNTCPAVPSDVIDRYINMDEGVMITTLKPFTTVSSGETKNVAAGSVFVRWGSTEEVHLSDAVLRPPNSSLISQNYQLLHQPIIYNAHLNFSLSVRYINLNDSMLQKAMNDFDDSVKNYEKIKGSPFISNVWLITGIAVILVILPVFMTESVKCCINRHSGKNSVTKVIEKYSS